MQDKQCIAWVFVCIFCHFVHWKGQWNKKSNVSGQNPARPELNPRKFLLDSTKLILAQIDMIFKNKLDQN